MKKKKKKPKITNYCEIVLIREGQCSWIVKNLLVRLGVISWVTGLLVACKIINYSVNSSWGSKYVDRGNPRDPRTKMIQQ